jgi:chromosome segregation ATPase
MAFFCVALKFDIAGLGFVPWQSRKIIWAIVGRQNMEDLFSSERKTLPDRLEALEGKLHKLVRENRTLRSERMALQEERRTLRQTIDRQREESVALQKQIKSSVIAASMTVGQDEVSALKNRLDAYVEELDRCLAVLEETV